MSTARTTCPSDHGFTLVELMLVMAIVATLILLAAPTYRNVISRAHRTDAMADLLLAAACQERTRATSGRYDTSRCLPAASDRYRFSYLETDKVAYFQIEAVPLGPQRQDPCGALLLDALGKRSTRQPRDDSSKCWSAR